MEHFLYLAKRVSQIIMQRHSQATDKVRQHWLAVGRQRAFHFDHFISFHADICYRKKGWLIHASSIPQLFVSVFFHYLSCKFWSPSFCHNGFARIIHIHKYDIHLPTVPSSLQLCSGFAGFVGFLHFLSRLSTLWCDIEIQSIAITENNAFF